MNFFKHSKGVLNLDMVEQVTFSGDRPETFVAVVEVNNVRAHTTLVGPDALGLAEAVGYPAPQPPPEPAVPEPAALKPDNKAAAGVEAPPAEAKARGGRKARVEKAAGAE